MGQVKSLESENRFYVQQPVAWGPKKQLLDTIFNETNQRFSNYYNRGRKSDLQKTLLQNYHETL